MPFTSQRDSSQSSVITFLLIFNSDIGSVRHHLYSTNVGRHDLSKAACPEDIRLFKGPDETLTRIILSFHLSVILVVAMAGW